jgi:hypothetical protein
MPATPTKLPLGLKVAYTAFMVVMVPIYLYMYGPTNFLYFCDTCLLLGFVACLTDNRLLASIPATGIILPQILWMADLVAEACGFHWLGMTSYMFDSSVPLWLRGISLYHVWLPFVLAYMVHKLGYDRRAFWSWTAIAWTLLVICYFTTSPPPAPAGSLAPVNVNFIYGFSSSKVETLLPLNWWFLALMIGVPFVTGLPTHRVLSRLYGKQGN